MIDEEPLSDRKLHRERVLQVVEAAEKAAEFEVAPDRRGPRQLMSDLCPRRWNGLVGRLDEKGVGCDKCCSVNSLSSRAEAVTFGRIAEEEFRAILRGYGSLAALPRRVPKHRRKRIAVVRISSEGPL